jgi:uncharacterized protein YbbC (DUF1343 family)/CubicO group peptidase (beta-lactamase class C family)
MRWIPFAYLLVSFANSLAQTPFPPERLSAIDNVIEQAITDAKTPGAVFRLERDGVVYQKAYGERAIVPKRETMTADTQFDAASLTKVVATTAAVMKLVENGRIEVEAPVALYLPEFSVGDKEGVTLRHLLTHTSGLRAGIGAPRGGWKSRADVLRAASREKLQAPPGTAYLYSDINFILLGQVVERVASCGLDEFCQREIFEPLGMRHTHFRTLNAGSADELASIAPTTVQTDGSVLRGVVHDPTARSMDGVAGHAGLFTTAEDLGRFGRMMLNCGELDGVRVFEKETVTAMTAVQSPPNLPRRGFGWDIDSPYAGPRGALFPIGSYGHTGWTGTRLWIDPFSRSITVFLSNRNHPDESGGVVGLQRELGTLAARAIPDFDFSQVAGALPVDSATTYVPRRVSSKSPVLNGIDVLKREEFRQLRGRKIGLVTNHTGLDQQQNSTIDLLQAAPDVKLVALFSPEHGIRGDQDHEKIGDSTDPKTGLPVYSLYGKNRAPTAAQLAGVDTLVFDIQDIGCRFYTYISTLSACLEMAGKTQRRLVVLDRLNPIGPQVEGPILNGERSFVGTHEIPLRHGMTVGELARLINAERGFGAALGVIRCEGGSPLRWLDETGQPWRNPSPNMRSLTAATLYPGVGLLEFCKVSVGRGTDTPFEVLGAPYLNDVDFAAALNQSGLPGIRFEPVRFTPTASVFANQECAGVCFVITDRQTFHAADLGMVLASYLHTHHPKSFGVEKMKPLLGDSQTLDAIRSGKPLNAIREVRDREVVSFETRRAPYLLYPR